MELHREHIAARRCTGKAEGIGAPAGDQPRISGLRIITVHKIKPAAVCDSLPQRMRHGLHHFVPAHVRHFELFALCINHARRRKAPHHTGQQTEAGRITFFAVFEQHLQTDADTEEGLGVSGSEQRAAQTARVHFTHAVRHRALSGKHHTAGLCHIIGIAGHHHLAAGCDMFDGLGYRTQVAHAVVDYCDVDGHRENSQRISTIKT